MGKSDSLLDKIDQQMTKIQAVELCALYKCLLITLIDDKPDMGGGNGRGNSISQQVASTGQTTKKPMTQSEELIERKGHMAY